MQPIILAMIVTVDLNGGTAGNRYKHLHGKYVVHPLDGRKVPIIQDAELVDMSFGTGAVKITPAHDPNDYATGKRHNLECVNILDDDGKINAHGGQFAGQPRFTVCTAQMPLHKSHQQL